MPYAGDQLAYDDYGPGPVLVLLHGFPFNRSMWKAQESGVGGAYRVIAADLRGQGESPAPAGIYDVDTMADDVIRLLDNLQITEPVALGGHSMGGYVALSAAIRYPERFRALILIDTRATSDTFEAALDREETAKRVMETGRTDEVVSASLAKVFSPLTRQIRAQVIDAAAREIGTPSPTGISGALRGMAKRPDRTAELSRITMPTLVIVGEDDSITPPDVARAMAEAIPNARLEVIGEAGHMAPIERPDLVGNVILGFLNELETR